MKYLGLDIGGSKIAAVVMDEQGHEWKRFKSEKPKKKPHPIITTQGEGKNPAAVYRNAGGVNHRDWG